jgi:hypothetical protein
MAFISSAVLEQRVSSVSGLLGWLRRWHAHSRFSPQI